MTGYSFTDNVRRALHAARDEANRLHHEYVGTEHILLGVLLVPASAAVRALHALGVDLEALRARIEDTVKTGRAGAALESDLPYTSRAKKVFELAMREARGLRDTSVGTEHLLLGLLGEEKGVAALALAQAGVGAEAIQREIQQQRKAAPTGPTPGPQRPSSLTILAEFPDGGLQAKRFSRLEDAIAHLAQWLSRQ